MRIIPISTLLIICNLLSLRANPVSEYVFPAITEILWEDSLHWTIEVNSSMVPSTVTNATYSGFKIFFSSTGQLYSFPLFFNDFNLGVVTPDSINQAPEEPLLLLRPGDTIFIPDVGSKEPFPNEQGWYCIPAKLQSGKSVIGLRESPGLISTPSSRTSIGTPGNYATTHHICIIDRDSLPVADMVIYYLDQDYDGTIMKHYLSAGISDVNGMISGIRVSIDNSRGFGLSRNSFASYSPYRSLDQGFSVHYIDSITEVTDTVIIAPNWHVVKVVDNKDRSWASVTSWMDYSLISVGMARQLGEKTAEGEFLFTMPRTTRDWNVDFVDSTENAILAVCTLSYSDTRDTIRHKIIVDSTFPLSARTVLKGIEPGRQQELTCRVTNRQAVYFIITNRNPVSSSSIDVCTVSGRVIATLPVSLRQTGTHTILWNGKGSDGSSASSGMYLCRLNCNGKTIITETFTIY